jgi:hypothetical protein
MISPRFRLCIISVIHQQLWGYKVEEKLHLRVQRTKNERLTITAERRVNEYLLNSMYVHTTESVLFILILFYINLLFIIIIYINASAFNLFIHFGHF